MKREMGKWGNEEEETDDEEMMDEQSRRSEKWGLICLRAAGCVERWIGWRGRDG